MSRVPVQFQAKFKEITDKCYADQCKWFLNGFWDQLSNDAEKIWGFSQLFIQLDEDKKKDGSSLDEFWSHKFLENLGETLTVIQLRDKLRTIDVDGDKRMSIIEYLMFRYNKDCEAIVKAPQGVDKQMLAEAQQKVEESQRALTELLARLEESKAATAKSKEAEAEAQAKANEAKKAADEAQAAADENKAALEELNKQEREYNDKIELLTKKSQEGSIVSRSKAANELAQLKNEDPLPLRKAKITQAASLKKAEKTAAIAKAAEDAANEAANAASQARAQAEAAEQQVAEATAQAEKRFAEAQAFLDDLKTKGGVGQGDIWWMERELEEKRKYLPGYKPKH